MNSKYVHDNIELSTIIARPLYFGLVANVVIPVALLGVCYYISNHGYVVNRLGETANTLFYVFAALSLCEAGFAIWWRGRLFNRPMIRGEGTFEADIASGFLRLSRPVFLVIASISVYGYIYFLLTGRFHEAVFFVVFSFVAFQIVRPRYGLARKVIERQKELVARGRFLTG
jgi:hypothetical protein